MREAVHVFIPLGFGMIKIKQRNFKNIIVRDKDFNYILDNFAWDFDKRTAKEKIAEFLDRNIKMERSFNQGCA